jgi:hypothetical protein
MCHSAVGSFMYRLVVVVCAAIVVAWLCFRPPQGVEIPGATPELATSPQARLELERAREREAADSPLRRQRAGPRPHRLAAADVDGRPVAADFFFVGSRRSAPLGADVKVGAADAEGWVEVSSELLFADSREPQPAALRASLLGFGSVDLSFDAIVSDYAAGRESRFMLPRASSQEFALTPQDGLDPTLAVVRMSRLRFDPEIGPIEEYRVETGSGPEAILSARFDSSGVARVKGLVPGQYRTQIILPVPFLYAAPRSASLIAVPSPPLHITAKVALVCAVGFGGEPCIATVIQPDGLRLAGVSGYQVNRVVQWVRSTSGADKVIVGLPKMGCKPIAQWSLLHLRKGWFDEVLTFVPATQGLRPHLVDFARAPDKSAATQQVSLVLASQVSRSVAEFITEEVEFSVLRDGAINRTVSVNPEPKEVFHAPAGEYVVSCSDPLLDANLAARRLSIGAAPREFDVSPTQECRVCRITCQYESGQSPERVGVTIGTGVSGSIRLDAGHGSFLVPSAACGVQLSLSGCLSRAFTLAPHLPAVIDCSFSYATATGR